MREKIYNDQRHCHIINIKGDIQHLPEGGICRNSWKMYYVNVLPEGFKDLLENTLDSQFVDYGQYISSWKTFFRESHTRAVARWIKMRIDTDVESNDEQSNSQSNEVDIVEEETN